MKSKQKSEKSDYGVSNNTGSFVVWLRGEKGKWLAGYIMERKNSPSAPIIRWRADFLLIPAVAACYFRNTFSIPFQCIRMENCMTAGGQPLYQATNRRCLLFQKTPFLLLLLLWHVIWPIAIDDKQWIQYKIWKQENMQWMDNGVLFENWKIFFCDYLRSV